MKYQRNTTLVSTFLIILVVFLCYSTSVLAHEVEVEDEREFDYSESSEKGPRHWGELKKEWHACKTGKLQSPIDMTSDRVEVFQKSEDLQMMYKPAQSIIKNRGHDISLQWPNKDAGSIKINGTEYFLQQAHWHSPSEHTINGTRYALELHMVHQSNDPNVKNNIVVVGLLYDFGSPNHFLSLLVGNISTMIDQIHEKPMGVIDPSLIERGCNKFYKYIGSLTVPPCTEGVTWIINRQTASVSKEQVHAIREAVHDYAEENARPLQRLNKRKIELYDPQAQPIKFKRLF
ncbi:alpha carbonic anhydrase 2 [Hibiscus trionum]|uniref:Carbonic anhydrase n=1 Tax=Hibiscus trionum TaxID=183268 RepID=A0A9W7MUM5_HIBTR|nr:alpha carbonic anhydrase 2 [Hibiscus trionum]